MESKAEMPDRNPRVLRKSNSVDVDLQVLARRYQAEYDYWLGEMATLKEKYQEAKEQTQIREDLLDDLRSRL